MQADFGIVLGVTVTGLVVVFIALILLIICISIMGAIVVKVQKKKAKKVDEEKGADQKAFLSLKTPAVAQESQDDGQLVAAITAAISCALGEEKSFVIKKIQKLPTNSAWGMAGRQQSMQPFNGGKR